MKGPLLSRSDPSLLLQFNLNLEMNVLLAYQPLEVVCKKHPHHYIHGDDALRDTANVIGLADIQRNCLTIIGR